MKMDKKILWPAVTVLLIIALYFMNSTNTFSVIKPTQPGLVSYWNFQGGAVTDLESNNHGSSFGGLLTEGKVGDSIQYATDTYVVIPNSDSLSPTEEFTLSLWIKLSEFPANELKVFDKATSELNGYSISITQDKKIKVCGNIFTFENCLVVPDKSMNLLWTNIAITMKDEKLKVYVNSEFVAEKNMEIRYATKDITLGKFNGTIDELTYFNVALDQGGITNYYNTVISGRQSVTPIAVGPAKYCYSVSGRQCIKREIRSGQSCEKDEFVEAEDCIIYVISKSDELTPEEIEILETPKESPKTNFLFILIAGMLVYLGGRRK